MTHKEALTLALELLAVGTFHSPELQAKRTEVIEQGLKALAQPEQKMTYQQAAQLINEMKSQPEQEPVQCWKCGDMDAEFQAKCDVPACGMKEGKTP